MTFYAKHISVSIKRPADEVYKFASNPANLPLWAAGLGGLIKKEDDFWTSDSPLGEIRIRFADNNSFGILDHYVTLPSGDIIYNPMRVFTNNDGCEVLFTLYRLPGMSDKQYKEDAQFVKKDLIKLKGMLERS